MKFGVYVHPTRPKVPREEIVKKIKKAGISFAQKDPDIAVVVGGTVNLAGNDINLIIDNHPLTLQYRYDANLLIAPKKLDLSHPFSVF